MTKKISWLLLSVILLGGIAFAEADANAANKSVLTEQVATPLRPTDQAVASLNDDTIDAAPAHYYGQTQLFRGQSERLTTLLLVPVGEYQKLDQAARNWAEQTHRAFADKTESGHAKIKGSINSFHGLQRYTSVVMTGRYQTADAVTSTQIVKTLIYDSNSDQLLDLFDFMSVPDYVKLRNHLLREEQIAMALADDEMLNNFYIAGDQLVFILDGPKYLAAASGVSYVRYSENQLAELGIVLNHEHAVPEPAESERPTLSKDDKIIALSFDDGPGPHTARLLDILHENQVTATFYLVGYRIDGRADLVRRMVEEGHEVANHSWNHPQFTKISDAQIKNQIARTQQKIADVSGVTTLAVRPPYGAVNKRVKRVARQQGVHFVNWTIDTLDWKTRSAQATYQSIINSAGDGKIILCHDIHGSTVDAMDRVIKELKARDYHVVSVQQLFEARAVRPQAGAIYFQAN